MALQSSDSTTHPFKSIIDIWMSKINLATSKKAECFQKWADESMRFFDGAHDWMWQDMQPKIPTIGDSDNQWMPMFRMTYNRMFEAVALLGPALYFRNPNVTCTPHQFPDIDPMALGGGFGNMDVDMQLQQMMMEQQYMAANRKSMSEMYESILNWLQVATNKKVQIRRAITDALIKGAGYLWCSVESPAQSETKIVRSTYINADDIFKDPDATQEDDVQWVARRCVHPLNVVEEKYGLPYGTLKGHIMSFDAEAQASKGRGKRGQATKESSYDLLEYYEIYSKNGFGHLLKGKDNRDPVSPIDVSQFGKYCYLAVAKNIPFPLNLPTDVVANGDMEDVFMRAQWPIPFWQDEPVSNGWPYTELGFYDKPGSVWPVSIFKPVAGEMRFINWCMSFLADKAASACQTIVGRAKAAGAEIQRQISGSSSPYTVVEISDILGKSVRDVYSFIESPAFPVDIWNVIAAVDERIDKRLGLTELMYGLSSRQMRSAAEANVKDQNVSVRPDDMSNTVEDFVSMTNLKEAEAARFLLEPQDVVPITGTLGAMLWQQHLGQTQPDDVVRSYSFRIEAGSARKPNKQAKVEQLTQFAQFSLPLMQEFAAQGMTGPWNAMMKELGDAMDIPSDMFMLNIPPPDPNQPSPEQEKAMVEQQKVSAQMEMDQQKHDQEMQQSQERHDQDMELSQEKAKAQAQAAKAKAKSQGAKK